MINNVVSSLNKFFDGNCVHFRKVVSPIIFHSGSFAGLSSEWVPVIVWILFIYLVVRNLHFFLLQVSSHGGLFWLISFCCLDECRSWENCFHSTWVGSLSFRRWWYFLSSFYSFLYSSFFLIYKWGSGIYCLYLITLEPFWFNHVRHCEIKWYQMIISLFYVFSFGLWIC